MFSNYITDPYFFRRNYLFGYGNLDTEIEHYQVDYLLGLHLYDLLEELTPFYSIKEDGCIPHRYTLFHIPALLFLEYEIFLCGHHPFCYIQECLSTYFFAIRPYVDYLD